MILDARMFDTFDRCQRRFAHERTHEPRTVTPTGLMYAGVEGSMTSADPCEGAKDAITQKTAWMDVNAGDLSPISAVRHVEAMAEVIGLALREKLGRATRPQPQSLGEHEWHSSLFVCSGKLHRIILVSYIDDDTLRSFAHSWGTIGELVAMQHPLTLTLVVIGAQRGGRRHSPWAKGFLHPIQKQLRIGRRKEGQADGFTTGWKEVWREQSGIKAETWLERMKSDEQLGDLIVSRRMQYRAEDGRMVQARKDMLTLAGQMESASPDAPMRRSSCDEIGRGACPFQPVCYSPLGLKVEDFPHLYRERETLHVELKAGTLAGHTDGHMPLPTSAHTAQHPPAAGS
jgi:hypothetical protein